MQASTDSIIELKPKHKKKIKSLNTKEKTKKKKKSKDESKGNGQKKIYHKLIMNVFHTKYEIVRKVAKELHFRLREEDPGII